MTFSDMLMTSSAAACWLIYTPSPLHSGAFAPHHGRTDAWIIGGAGLVQWRAEDGRPHFSLQAYLRPPRPRACRPSRRRISGAPPCCACMLCSWCRAVHRAVHVLLTPRSADYRRAQNLDIGGPPSLASCAGAGSGLLAVAHPCTAPCCSRRFSSSCRAWPPTGRLALLALLLSASLRRVPDITPAPLLRWTSLAASVGCSLRSASPAPPAQLPLFLGPSSAGRHDRRRLRARRRRRLLTVPLRARAALPPGRSSAKRDAAPESLGRTEAYRDRCVGSAFNFGRQRFWRR